MPRQKRSPQVLEIARGSETNLRSTAENNRCSLPCIHWRNSECKSEWSPSYCAVQRIYWHNFQILPCASQKLVFWNRYVWKTMEKTWSSWAFMSYIRIWKALISLALKKIFLYLKQFPHILEKGSSIFRDENLVFPGVNVLRDTFWENRPNLILGIRLDLIVWDFLICCFVLFCFWHTNALRLRMRTWLT